MGADAKSHSQTLSRDQVVLQWRGERVSGTRSVWDRGTWPTDSIQLTGTSGGFQESGILGGLAWLLFMFVMAGWLGVPVRLLMIGGEGCL